MKRSVLCIVPRYGKFIQMKMLENGDCELLESAQWKRGLYSSTQDRSFRALVAPKECHVPEEQYFQWDLALSASDQDYWLGRVLQAMDAGSLANMPLEVKEQLLFFCRCAKGQKVQRWSNIPLLGNERFAHLLAYLTCLNALSRVRKSKCFGVKKQQIILGDNA